MFSIIISEKGGAERREAFDRTEINVGRVQGNDLMLPKGNVSKRHARLLFRDGRFIVTDLKSTNGTYVNGRKIAQATIVREGDKIYIGDFVLRIELSAEAAALAANSPEHASIGPESPVAEDSSQEPSSPGEPQQRPASIAPPAQAPAPPQAPAPLPAPPPLRHDVPAGARETSLGAGPRLDPARPGGAPQAGPALGLGGPTVTPPPLGGAIAPAASGGGLGAPGNVGALQPPPVGAAPPPMPSPVAAPGLITPNPVTPNPVAPSPVAPGLVAPPSPVQSPFPGAASGPVHAPPPMVAPQEPAAVAPPPFVAATPAPVGMPVALSPSPVAIAPSVSVGIPQPVAVAPMPPTPLPASSAAAPYAQPQPVSAPLTPVSGSGSFPHLQPPQPNIAPAIVAPGTTPRAPSVSPASSVPPITSSASIGEASAVQDAGASVPPRSGASAFPASSQPSTPRSGVKGAAANEGVVQSGVAALHRAALSRLIERTAAAVDLGALDHGDSPPPTLAASIERTLAEKAAAMKHAGEIPEGLDSDMLVGEARRELFEFGPIGPLLEDEHVEEVQLVRHDDLVALHGQKQVSTEIAFSSEAAVARLVRRLCARSGARLGQSETHVVRRLDGGVRLFGVLPPSSGDGHLLVFRKARRATQTLEDLVRSGTIGRNIATLLGFAVQGRANILVAGSAAASPADLLGALASAGSPEDRVIVLQDEDELILQRPHCVSILSGDGAEGRDRSVRTALRVRPDRLIVGAFSGALVGDVVDAIGDGLDGVIAATRAQTLRQLVARLPADVGASKKLTSLEPAREWIAGAFDLLIEVARLRDGRTRVMRVAEFGLNPANPLELRDIFQFVAERTASGGLVDGSFAATGVIPRLAEDLVARGTPMDLALFKKTAK